MISDTTSGACIFAGMHRAIALIVCQGLTTWMARRLHRGDTNSVLALRAARGLRRMWRDQGRQDFAGFAKLGSPIATIRRVLIAQSKPADPSSESLHILATVTIPNAKGSYAS